MEDSRERQDEEMKRKRAEKDGVAAYQFQSATVVQFWLYLVFAALVVVAHTVPLHCHRDAKQGQLVCETRRTLYRTDANVQIPVLARQNVSMLVNVLNILVKSVSKRRTKIILKSAVMDSTLHLSNFHLFQLLWYHSSTPHQHYSSPSQKQF